MPVKISFAGQYLTRGTKMVVGCRPKGFKVCVIGVVIQKKTQCDKTADGRVIQFRFGWQFVVRYHRWSNRQTNGLVTKILHQPSETICMDYVGYA